MSPLFLLNFRHPKVLLKPKKFISQLFCNLVATLLQRKKVQARHTMETINPVLQSNHISEFLFQSLLQIFAAYQCISIVANRENNIVSGDMNRTLKYMPSLHITDHSIRRSM